MIQIWGKDDLGQTHSNEETELTDSVNSAFLLIYAYMTI